MTTSDLTSGPVAVPVITQRSISVPWGVVHARETGAAFGRPLVCVPQTPRSGDEFREFMLLLGGERHVVAFDIAGMGHSTPHPDGDTIAAYADAVAHAIGALVDTSDRPLDLLGHHTGAAVAAELAARHPDLVATLVLSSPPWTDAAERELRAARPGPGIDEITRDPSGANLGALWDGRASFYPPGRADLLDRFVADALLVADPHAGHAAVANWVVENTLDALREAAVIIVDQAADPFAHPQIEHWQRALPRATVVTNERGMVPFEHSAEQTVEHLRHLLV